MSQLDEVTRELEAWTQINDQLLVDAKNNTISLIQEPQSRALLECEFLVSISQAIVSNFFDLKERHFRLIQDCDVALRQAREKLSRDVAEQQQRFDVRERMMTAELNMKMELKKSELESDAVKQKIGESLRSEIAELSKKKNDLQVEIESLHVEAQQRRLSTQSQKLKLTDEIQDLEHQLNTLKLKVSSEKSLLNHVQTQREEPALPPLRRSIDPQTPTPQDSMQKSPPELGKAATNVTAGLAALYSVREQLREIRESTGGGGGNLLPKQPMRNDQSIVTPLRKIEQDSPAAVVGSNPWKARLLKLQGDLKTLRSELGTTPTR